MRRETAGILVSVVVCNVLAFGVEAPSSADGLRDEELRAVYGNPMCGPNCLWQVARLFGKNVELSQMAYSCNVIDQRQASLWDLVETAKGLGLDAVAVKTNCRGLREEPRVAILHIFVDIGTELCGHYVLLDSITENHVRIVDGRRLINMDVGVFKSHWDGYAVLIGREPSGGHRTRGGLLSKGGGSVPVLGVFLAVAVLLVFSRSRYRPTLRVVGEGNAKAGLPRQ